MVPLQAGLCPLVAESVQAGREVQTECECAPASLVELLSRGKLCIPSAEESSGICACQIAPAPGRDVGRSDESQASRGLLTFSFNIFHPACQLAFPR